MTVTLRPWRDDDWPRFEPIFRAVVEQGTTYAIDPAIDDAAAQALWADAAHRVVAVDGDTVLGSAKMGPNRPAHGAHVGTASFMVGEAARGRGVGRALGEYVVQWHRDQGFRGIQFNAVVSTNESAVRLWQSLGFDVVGTVPDGFALPSGSFADLYVMHLPLRSSAAPDAPPEHPDAQRDAALLVAAQHFADRGWAGTTRADIARESGVPVGVVDRMFPTDAELLMAAFRRVSFGERTNLQEALAALDLEQVGDVDERLDRLVQFACEVLAPMAPLVAVMNEAAGSDTTALAVRQGAELRRLGTSRAVVGLVTRGEGASPEAVAIVQMLTSAETFLAFRSLGWSKARYAGWLRGALDHAVNGTR